MAQPFPVQKLLAWDVPSQSYLTYITDAPAIVIPLNLSNLSTDTVVIIRRDASAAVALMTEQRTATVSYYYCVQVSNSAGIGDGGGFCGSMASGQMVYEGAVSCVPGHMDQWFTIQGDPNSGTYTCADTGGAVADEHRDIFFQNSDDAWAWWMQMGSNIVTIEIVQEHFDH